MTLYRRLPIDCDCSITSMTDAVHLIGPAFVYTLYVSPSRLLYMRLCLHQHSADVKDNPLAPYINLSVDSALRPYEWVLEANNTRVGSPGA